MKPSCHYSFCPDCRKVVKKEWVPAVGDKVHFVDGQEVLSVSFNSKGQKSRHSATYYGREGKIVEIGKARAIVKSGRKTYLVMPGDMSHPEGCSPLTAVVVGECVCQAKEESES